MSTSGSYNFTVNRDQVIRLAMLNINRLDETEAPTATDITDCSVILNMMIKQWQGKSDFAPGLKVWTRKRTRLFLDNTKGQYTVGPAAIGWTDVNTVTTTTVGSALGAGSITVSDPTQITAAYHIGIELGTGNLQWTTVLSKVGAVINLNTTLSAAVLAGATVYCYQTGSQMPLNVEAAVLRDQFGNDTPLKIMTQKEYDFLPSKVAPDNIGDPTAILLETGLLTQGGSTIFTDVAASQDVTKFIVVTNMQPVQDMTLATDEFYYPQEWFLAIAWGLSKQVAPMYNCAWTPLMQSNYADAMAIAGHKDAETSAMFFQCGEDG